MKRFLLLLFISCIALVSRAQQNHFIYLQTDNKQTFYVRLNDKMYSSSASGYVVIPKLQKGDYSLVIGFPKNEWPQQNVAVKVNADLGYLLKNFGEKGWGLFNMQSMEVVMASTSPVPAVVKTEAKTDAFSNVLADVVNTPSLKEQPVAKVPVAAVKEPVEPVKPAEAEPKPATNPVVIAPVATASEGIRLASSAIDANGRSAVYVDPAGNDTIRVFIPYPAVINAAPEVQKDAPAVSNKEKEKEVPEVVKEVPKVEPAPVTKEDKRFLGIELPNPNAGKDSTSTAAVVSPGATTDNILKPLTINSDCKALATEEDFVKIRKKMASGDNDDEMIAAARKQFKSKCYSTEQVKNLGLLFLKDEGRYKFFDAAYPFVNDTQNFASLQSQLTEEYYVNRFKAMIRR